MSRNEAKKIVRKYAKTLKENGVNFSAIYLFGSYAQDKGRFWSDIDVAVVFNRLDSWTKKEKMLWKIGRQVNTKIEPISFLARDFTDISNPMVYEVRKRGIKIS